MMYAKRCMAILTHRSPRKSNLVIMKGKQWIVDWATGALTRCEPPDYGELDRGRENGVCWAEWTVGACLNVSCGLKDGLGGVWRCIGLKARLCTGRLY